MKITAATITDFKRIRHARIAPDADVALLLVAGNNAQGKTSALDGIAYALAGAAAKPIEAVRRGAEKAEIIVELDGGRYTIRRVVPADGDPRVEITGPDGRIAKPQAWLDKLIGAGMLDPLAFMAGSKPEDARRRRDTLLRAIGVDLDAFAEEHKRLTQERVAVGRLATQAEAALAAMPAATPRPTEARSQAAIRADLDALEGERRTIADLDAKHTQTKTVHDGLTARRARLVAELAEIDGKLAEIEPILAGHIEKQPARAARLESLAERRAALVAESGQAETLSRWEAAAAVADRQRKQAEETATKQRAEYDRLTGEIEAIGQRKQAALAGAELPVPGLGVTDTGLTLDGVPFEQASSAEKMKVSLAVAMKLAPGLQDILVRDGSLLDDDSLAELHAAAMFANCRLWIERVGEKDEGAIVIRDGRVLGAGEAV